MSLDSQETHCHRVRVLRASRQQQVGQQVRQSLTQTDPSSLSLSREAAAVPWPGPVCPSLLDT